MLVYLKVETVHKWFEEVNIIKQAPVQFFWHVGSQFYNFIENRPGKRKWLKGLYFDQLVEVENARLCQYSIRKYNILYGKISWAHFTSLNLSQ